MPETPPKRLPSSGPGTAFDLLFTDVIIAGHDETARQLPTPSPSSGRT